MLFLRKLLFASVAGLALCAAASPALARPSYPIKAADYRKQVEKRVDNLWASIEKKLDFHNVTTERKKAIRKMLDEEARPMWVEVERAGADGNVTRDEALKIRELQTGLRGKLRTRMAAAKKAENEPAATSKPPAANAARTAATTPAKPAATTPAKPAATTPAKPAATTPAKPAATTPAKPATPSKPAPAKGAPADHAKGAAKTKPAEKPAHATPARRPPPVDVDDE